MVIFSKSTTSHHRLYIQIYYIPNTTQHPIKHTQGPFTNKEIKITGSKIFLLKKVSLSTKYIRRYLATQDTHRIFRYK
jgi:hypothetical protein